MTISIVIPNYNGKELLEKNLPKVVDAIKEYHSGKAEIIVIDDASPTDNSVEFLQNFANEFKEKNIEFVLLQNKINLGFSPTVDKAVSYAQGEVVVLLNSDVVPEKDFLAPLLAHFQDETVFAVGCIENDEENNRWVGRSIGKWQRGFLVHKPGDIHKHNTLWASGGSSAFRKSLWDKLGGLDIIYTPFYYEDIDLSYRALKSGYQVLFEEKSRVLHEHKKGAIRSKFKNSTITKTAYRNQFIFTWKNVTDNSILLSHLYWLPYHFLKALARGDWVFFSGFFQALLLFPQVLKHRQFAKKLFVKTDREVIQDFRS